MSSNGQVKLKEFAELVNQPYQPSSDESINYIGLEHIEQQTLRLNGIGNSSDVISQKHKFKAGDILFGKLRPYFRKVVRPSFDGVCSTDIWVVRAKPGFDQSFLFYFLANKSFIDECNSSSSGTRMPRADWNHLSETLWELPTLPEQKRIAEILSALDDKIELNRQTNATLEAIAQAVFKEWFVDFNYPGATGELVNTPLGLIPDGWKVQEIGNLFSFVIGGDWGKEDFSSEFSEECRVIRGTDLDNIRNGDVSDIPIRFIKKTSLEKRKIIEGDIVFEISGGSRDQSTGRNQVILQDTIDLLQLPVIPTSFCRLIRTENIWTSIFLSTYLSIFYKSGGPWDFQLQSTGISNFQFKDFSKRHLLINPPDEIMVEFFNLVYPMYKFIDNLNMQSTNISTIRNLLLPRLMSGEIEV